METATIRQFTEVAGRGIALWAKFIFCNTTEPASGPGDELSEGGEGRGLTYFTIPATCNVWPPPGYQTIFTREESPASRENFDGGNQLVLGTK